MFQTTRITIITKKDKTSEKELNRIEVSCLLDKEFKEIVIKMLIKLLQSSG